MVSDAHPTASLPADFSLPALPPELDAWFAFAATRGDATEVIAYGEHLDGAVLDDLGVVDAASARLALVGYRWVWEGGVWIDQAATGGWDARWIVLDSVNADPIIADVSVPGVPVLTAPHGEGEWRAERVAPTLAEFIAELAVNEVSGPPPFEGPHDAWSVWATDLGPSPLRTLVSLLEYPLFPHFSRIELLAMRDRLPLLLVDGLTETAARACVAHGARWGARFEARTHERAADVGLDDVDIDELLEADDDYTEPAPSDQLIASIEDELGFRLPDAYVALARRRNGGRLRRDAHPMAEPTACAEDHIAVTGLSAIGRTAPSSLCGELGSTFMRDEWGYPAWGVGIADTPSAGHEQVMLDYRACGPQGEPRVVHVDQEADYAVTEIAPDFAAFVRGLVDADTFDTSDPVAEKADALRVVATGSLSPIIVRAIAAEPQGSVVEPALRELGRRLVERYGFFTVRDDNDSRRMLDAMFLLHSRVGRVSGVDDFLAPTGETSYDRPSLPLMLFFAISDEPYAFRTGGFAPDVVREWWTDRQERGAFTMHDASVRFTPAYAQRVRTALREDAASAGH